MRLSPFEAEAERCRRLAHEYDGRAEARFLISAADAFRELKEGQSPEEKPPVQGIRLFA